MYDEVMAGPVEHKLSYATWHNAWQEFVFPATWTDGFCDDGFPQPHLGALGSRHNAGLVGRLASGLVYAGIPGLRWSADVIYTKDVPIFCYSLAFPALGGTISAFGGR